MSLTLACFLLAFVVLAVLTFYRPVFGVSFYLLTFFAHPGYWWWGEPVNASFQRWNLVGGIFLLGAVVLSGRLSIPFSGNALIRRIQWAAIAMAINATLVHLLLAPDTAISAGPYWQLVKFVLFFFLIVAAAATERDLKIILLSILIGAGYIGYEQTINDRGDIVHGRLEGIGAPGATGANQLASLMVTVLPLTGAFFLAGKRWEKVLMLPIAPFLVNVVLLCNSRGAFLSAIASAILLLVMSPPNVRKKTLQLVGFGALAVWLLLGDPRIVERFWTTFAKPEERDESAAGRLEYWKAGLQMIRDHPFGTGGNGFKRVYGPRYIKMVAGTEFEARSVHNGFINQACEWGIQGLLLQLTFIGGGILLAYRLMKSLPAETELFAKLLGLSIITGTLGFLGECMFGSFLDAEWGYWFTALSVAYFRVYHGRVPIRRERVEPVESYASISGSLLATGH